MKSLSDTVKIYSVLTFVVAGSIVLIQGCKHDPPLTVNEQGNGNNGGNGNGGNGGGTGIPCDPDTVYFEQQILPILASNCAMSGCHDAASAQDGVILISYSSVMNTADVTPFDPGDSDLYEVITETDPDKVMPEPPNAPLTSQQINLIATWINQGAQNFTCNPNYGQCDTTNVSFNGTVKTIIDLKCKGCHNPQNLGGGINLSVYSGVQAVANSNQLVGAITHTPGFSAMPKNTSQLPSCEIAQIRNWVTEGALNN